MTGRRDQLLAESVLRSSGICNVEKVVQHTFSIFHTRRSIINTKLVTAQIRVKNWTAIIQDRNRSGLSVKDYCAQHQLSRDSYYYWLRKVKETLLTESGFVEVTQPERLPVPETKTDNPKEMMTLTFCEMQLDIPISVQRDTLCMIVEVTVHAQ